MASVDRVVTAGSSPLQAARRDNSGKEVELAQLRKLKGKQEELMKQLTQDRETIKEKLDKIFA